ncbi:MAG: sulfurtransferase TusA family protein [Gammaproteobacteria bacterium]|nr:sulfurtransferase TusA family protein [Gammaproteobacteria bacterium]
MSYFDKEASSVGSCCPMPLIELELAIKGMEKGMILRMSGDDPIFESGIRDYCDVKGYEIISVKEVNNHIDIFIRV